jgi:flagellin
MTIFFSTNVPELRSIITFNRLSLDIANIMQRLATGQRIVSAKDDPSGLTARELMRADIRGIQVAQENTNRANSLFATADSGLADISQLLHGDPTDPSDTGLLGLIYDDTVPTSLKKAQIDDILNMVDSIARSTTYNGKAILGGALDYITSGLDSRMITNLLISKATVPAQGGQSVTIKILDNAQRGMLSLNQSGIGSNDVTLKLQNNQSLTFTAGMSAQEIIDLVNQNTTNTGVTARGEEGFSKNQLVVSSVGNDNDLVFTVKDGNTGEFSIVLEADSSVTDNTITQSSSGSSTLFTFTFGTLTNPMPTAAEFLNILNSSNILEATPGDLQAFQDVFKVELAAGQKGGGLLSESSLMAEYGDALDGNGLQFFGDGSTATKVEMVNNGLLSSALSSQLSGDTLTIELATDANGNVTTTAKELVDYLNELSATETGGISVSLLRPAGQSYTNNAAATTNSGYGIVTPTSTAIDLVASTDPNYRTVNAEDIDITKIIFETTSEGSRQSIQIQDIDGNLFFTDRNGNATTTASGTDMIVTVNNEAAEVDGRYLNFASLPLAFSARLSDNVKKDDMIHFNIIGGGGTFQLGKDVQDELQYRTGIPNVDSAHLGGRSGFLGELRQIDFETNTGKQKAYNIISEAVNQVAMFRAVIGSKQKYIFDVNSTHLDTQLEKVSEAEAGISNADTALESSRLTRAELLAESAMNSILFSRSFTQYFVQSLFA